MTPFGYLIGITIATVVIGGLSSLAFASGVFLARFAVRPRGTTAALVRLFGWLNLVVWLLPLVGVANSGVIYELRKDHAQDSLTRWCFWAGLVLAIGMQVYFAFKYFPRG